MSITKGKPWLPEIQPSRTFQFYPEQLKIWKCPENLEHTDKYLFTGKGLSVSLSLSLFFMYTYTHHESCRDAKTIPNIL